VAAGSSAGAGLQGLTWIAIGVVVAPLVRVPQVLWEREEIPGDEVLDLVGAVRDDGW
jgi:hypothetical protein